MYGTVREQYSVYIVTFDSRCLVLCNVAMDLFTISMGFTALTGQINLVTLVE